MRTQAICLTLTVVLFSASAVAQWKQIGPYVGPAVCFATSGSAVFAGVPGAGVLVSTDNGTTWTAANTGLRDSTVLALLVSGSTLFVGTAGGGVYRSTDNGTSWTAVNEGVPRASIDSTRYAQINSFAASGQNLFMGTSDRGVLLSTNSGTSWTEVTEGLPGDNHGLFRVSALVAFGQYIFAGTSAGVSLSTNNGASWAAVNDGLPNPDVWSLGISGTWLLAGTYDGGVCLSPDSGAHWTPVNEGLPRLRYDSTRYVPITCLASYEQSLFAATYDGVFRSTNNGASWNAENNGMLNAAVHALGVSGTTIFAGTILGISVSTDNGSSWTRRTTGALPGCGITAVAVRGTELYAATVWGGGLKSRTPVSTYLVHSTDNGESWVPQLEADGSAIIIRDADAFVGTVGAGMFRSTNHGTSWTAVNQGLPNALWGYGDTSGYPRIYCFASSGQDLFAGTYGRGLFRFTNDGSSWVPVIFGSPINSIFSLAFCGTVLLAGTDAGVFRSTNNGTNWSSANTGLPEGMWPPNIGSFAMHATNVLAGGTGTDMNGVELSGIFLSTDSGSTWTATAHVPDYYGGYRLLSTGNSLFAASLGHLGSSYFGIFVSTDYSASWRSVCSEDCFWGGAPIAANDEYLFVGDGGWHMWGASGSGLWRRPLAEMITSVDPAASEVPHEFLLSQNYPNPFNPSTTIRYGLPSRSHATLTVFNTLGQRVATLVEGEVEAGYPDVRFDGTQFASGVYLYRLQAGDLVQTRKWLLIK